MGKGCGWVWGWIWDSGAFLEVHAVVVGIFAWALFLVDFHGVLLGRGFGGDLEHSVLRTGLMHRFVQLAERGVAGILHQIVSHKVPRGLLALILHIHVVVKLLDHRLFEIHNPIVLTPRKEGTLDLKVAVLLVKETVMPSFMTLLCLI